MSLSRKQPRFCIRLTFLNITDIKEYFKAALFIEREMTSITLDHGRGMALFAKTVFNYIATVSFNTCERDHILF